MEESRLVSLVSGTGPRRYEGQFEALLMEETKKKRIVCCCDSAQMRTRLWSPTNCVSKEDSGRLKLTSHALSANIIV
jgi:hypothetical protein